MSANIIVENIKAWIGLQKSNLVDDVLEIGSLGTPRFTYNGTMSMKSEKEFIPNSHVKLSDVMHHNKLNDIWAIFDKKVYDVTNYIIRHPELVAGLMDCIGKDCTHIFKLVHPTMSPCLFFKDELVGYLV